MGHTQESPEEIFHLVASIDGGGDRNFIDKEVSARLYIVYFSPHIFYLCVAGIRSGQHGGAAKMEATGLASGP